jgi:peptide/nickel transport system permease protein
MAGIGAAPAGEVRYRSGERSRLRIGSAAMLRFTRGKPLGAVSAIILALFLSVALLATVLAPYSPVSNNSRAQLQGPSLRHLMGTDQYGRDVFSRILFGARTSLYVGVGATLIGGVAAVVIGVVSASAGGSVDYLIQRVVDTVQAIPPIILLIALLVVLGPSLTNVILALSLRSAFVTSRVMRGSALTILKQPYVDAGRIIGCSHLRLMSIYVLPNIMASVIVLATANFGAAILAEATLSFLGYGVPPPTPSWGGMLSAEGRSFMFVAPWLLIAPTAALSAVVFAANMFGDALRDILDPRLRQAGSGSFS